MRPFDIDAAHFEISLYHKFVSNHPHPGVGASPV